MYKAGMVPDTVLCRGGSGSLAMLFSAHEVRHSDIMNARSLARNRVWWVILQEVWFVLYCIDGHPLERLRGPPRFIRLPCQSETYGQREFKGSLLPDGLDFPAGIEVIMD